jgi:hypothetical protein
MTKFAVVETITPLETSTKLVVLAAAAAIIDGLAKTVSVTALKQTPTSIRRIEGPPDISGPA